MILLYLTAICGQYINIEDNDYFAYDNNGLKSGQLGMKSLLILIN